MELKGHIYAKPHDWKPDTVEYKFHELSPDGDVWDFIIEQGWTVVQAMTITHDEICPLALVQGQVKALIARKEKLETECKREVEKIDNAIANLRCLEFSPASAD